MFRLLMFSLVLLAGPGLQAAVERPNLIVIMPDDQGYGDLGYTGNSVARTPHINALAAASATLSNFYVSPVCSPTRACLMTGRYNHRTRVIDTFKGRSMMDPDEVTVAEILHGAGYTTGIFGKWHLGDNYPLRPMEQGFDEVLVHRGGGLAQPSEPLENRRRYTDPILFHNGQQVQTKGYCTDVYFDAALEFIDQARERKRPFFIYLPTNAPHGPFHDVPEALYEYYKSVDLSPILGGRRADADKVARILAMVENIDHNVGRLRDRLKQRGLEKDTLIFFLVDNGPNTRRYVGPYRGMKSEVHEGGIRSPLFACWPGHLKPGVVSDRIAAHIDLLPTLVAAAGVTLPEDLKLDGRNLLPLLERRTVEWPDRHLVIQAHRGDAPVPFHNVAVRGQRWKLVHPTGFGRESMPDGVPFELFDLEKDPGETLNLAGNHPLIVTRLQGVYRSWLKDVSGTRPDNFAPPRIVIGTKHELVTVLSKQDWRVGDTPGWGNAGAWQVRFAQGGAYRVAANFEEAFGPGEATLHVGNNKWTQQVGTSVDRVSWDKVVLPAGETNLRVAMKQAGRPVNPYHVMVSQARE